MALSLPGGNQLTITDERPTTVMTTPAADPAPLGLAAFALTTFLLSAANAHWMTTATGDAWLGYAFAYGGLAQFAAGMWEFRNRNVFGSTAFSTYGGFWIGLGLWAVLVHAPATDKDLGWIFLAFFIFISNFAGSSGIGKFAGYIAIITALTAWYASAAGVINGMKGRMVLPVG